jgi:AraC family transcriptional regulator
MGIPVRFGRGQGTEENARAHGRILNRDVESKFLWSKAVATVGDACAARAANFQHSMGESVHRYVTSRRIERAQVLLRTGILSLPEIAETVGFSDQSHFTTVFKRHLQVTPSAYRRMMR